MKKNKKIFLLFISFCIFFSCFKTLVKADEVLIQSNSALDELNNLLTKFNICDEFYGNCALTVKYIESTSTTDFLEYLSFESNNENEIDPEFFAENVNFSNYLLEVYFDSFKKYLSSILVGEDCDISWEYEEGKGYKLEIDDCYYSDKAGNTEKCYLNTFFSVEDDSDIEYTDTEYYNSIDFIKKFLFPSDDMINKSKNSCSSFNGGYLFQKYTTILEEDHRYTLLKIYFQENVYPTIQGRTYDIIPSGYSNIDGKIILDPYSVFSFYYYVRINASPHYLFPYSTQLEFENEFGYFLKFYIETLYDGLRKSSSSGINNGLSSGDILSDVIVTSGLREYNNVYIKEQLMRVKKYLDNPVAVDSDEKTKDIKGNKYMSLYYKDLYSLLYNGNEKDYDNFSNECIKNYDDFQCLNVLEFGRDYTNFDYSSAQGFVCNSEKNINVWATDYLDRDMCYKEDINSYCNSSVNNYDRFCTFLRAYTVEDNVTDTNCYKEAFGENTVCSIRIPNVDMSRPYIPEYPKEKPKFKDLLSNWFSKHEVNDADCVSLFDAEIKGLINYVLSYIRIIVPILIIVLGSIDLFKAVIANDEDGMKKAQKHFIKRLLFGLAVFLAPSLINILMWAVEKGLNVGNYSCELDLKL